MRLDFLLVALFAMLAMFYLVAGDNIDDDGTLANYCEMRQIWQDSQGEYGWRESANPKYDDGDCK